MSDKIDSATFAPVIADWSNFTKNLSKYAGRFYVCKAPKSPWVHVIIVITSVYAQAGDYSEVAEGLPHMFTGNVDYTGIASSRTSSGLSCFISFDGKLYASSANAHSGAVNEAIRLDYLSDNPVHIGV